MFPLIQVDDGHTSLRPAVEEIAFLRDTVFSHAAAGLFGEAGLMHFLASGQRSAASIATFVELIRDGDLAMRRHFGPRMRKLLRVRAGEALLQFDLEALATATAVHHFGEIIVQTA